MSTSMAQPKTTLSSLSTTTAATTPTSYYREETPITAPSKASPITKKKIREMRLREDPLADVQNPGLVVCLNCGSPIKLSTKSDYDSSHWNRHRTRCLKKYKKSTKPSSVSPPSSESSTVSPSSTTRLLTPPPDEDGDVMMPFIAGEDDYEPPAPLPLPDWQSWNWSLVKSRFDVQLKNCGCVAAQNRDDNEKAGMAESSRMGATPVQLPLPGPVYYGRS
ncbi:hypothetical protein R3P38DRAFT_2953289 [Favolaschia claudopus]|uniref:Uncharacterized protein n=1 Tax=Favolaschia claudopus TaxID=2862362 RepID=A0AAW0BG38_9AGAR